MGYGVGPGRGSGAGSLVNYCMGITALDPLQYNLLFERFLNKERVSMPDIDVDFSNEIRDNLVQYVKNISKMEMLSKYTGILINKTKNPFQTN